VRSEEAIGADIKKRALEEELRQLRGWSGPETWVTQCTGYMANTLGPSGFYGGLGRFAWL
jgi:hypothetical protein